jgi:hypothetical protein
MASLRVAGASLDTQLGVYCAVLIAAPSLGDPIPAVPAGSAFLTAPGIVRLWVSEYHQLSLLSRVAGRDSRR